MKFNVTNDLLTNFLTQFHNTAVTTKILVTNN